MKKRPNIIIFNPDEMRYDAMSHMGNPAAETPFLDEFAGRMQFLSGMLTARTVYAFQADAAFLPDCIHMCMVIVQ